MAQGWSVSATADTITFLEAPPAGTGNVVVKEFAAGAVGGTDVWAVGAWSARYGFPREIEFFGDRLWFAGTNAEPQRIDASMIGDYVNFGRSSPIVDSDAVSITINARQVNSVRDLVPLDTLLVLTTSIIWKTTAGQSDVITPSTIGMKPQARHGASHLPAKVMGESAIFVEEQGPRIRDLGYQFEKDGFRGNDISVWADHLFTGYTVTGIEQSSAPYPVLWFPRDDGQLNGCTYMPEQEVIGWHRHDTDGKILDTCVLPGTNEDEVYWLVERVINGQTVQYLEQVAPFLVPDQRDMIYMDSALTYDGRNTTATTLTLSTGAGWTADDVLTATSSAPLFVGAGDEGDGLEIEVSGVKLRLVIETYIDATHAQVRSIGDVAAPFQNVPLGSWVFQRNTIGGLSHLEGKEVAILADATVHPPRTVTGGLVTLDRPYGVVSVGLPYRGHVETLELNVPGGEPVRAQKKLAYKVGIHVIGSRGLKSGGNLDELDEFPQREFENYDDPVSRYNGTLEMNITAGWGEENGHVHIVSDDPLPMEILGIILKAAASD